MKKTGLVLGSILLICGLMSLFYGVFNIGSLVLLLIGLLFFFCSLCWAKMPHILRMIFLVSLCLGFSISVLVSAFMVRQAWFTPPPIGENLPIIVLGGRVYEDGPSLIVAYRLNAAAEYLKENPQAVCVVSGGKGADEPKPEAEVMAQYLTSKYDIHPKRIIVEDKSTNTLENIRFSYKLLNTRASVIIVTDSFHQLRASIFAKAEGLRPYSVSSYTPIGLFPSYWVRDMLGVIYTIILNPS